MPVHLILFQGGHRLGLDLKDGVYRVGRDEPADIVVPDKTISSVHAEIQVMGVSVLLRDLGSTNGTFVNDERIRAARELKPSDRIRLGGVQVTIEYPAEKKERLPQTAPIVPAIKQQTEVLRAASGRLPWTLRAWLAGVYAILFLLVLFLFAQLYYASVSAQRRLEGRFQTLAAQYVHVLSDPAKPVPPPIVDRSLGEPLMVANRGGKIVYPAPPPGEEIQSPLLDPKTKRVYDQAKNGLVSASVAGAKKGERVPVRCYPVRKGGEIVGYVIARPGGEGVSDTALVMAILVLSALAAGALLFFTMRPVTQMMRLQLKDLREKVVPLANGFVESLPRSNNVPELGELAGEIEKAIRMEKAVVGKAQPGGQAGHGEYDVRLAELIEAARYPYCFLDNDFKVVMMSDDLVEIRELAGMRIGRSLFDSKMTSIQSKQLVQAMTVAKQDRKPSATNLELERDDTPTSFRITAIAFSAGSRGHLYGLVLVPAA